MSFNKKNRAAILSRNQTPAFAEAEYSYIVEVH